jgi:hypothetical protein
VKKEMAVAMMEVRKTVRREIREIIPDSKFGS